MEYIQSINTLWMKQNEWIKICFVILAVLFALWINKTNFNSSTSTGIIDGIAIVDKNTLLPINATPCGQKGEPECQGFIGTEGKQLKVTGTKAMSITYTEAIDNTTCFLIYTIAARTYQTSFEINGPCPKF